MDLRQQMKAAVLEAGEIALRHYGHASFEVKADDSVITVADREVDAFLEERTRAILPDAAYIGEEVATASAASATEKEWVWIVDPVDGTAGFTDGLDTWCVCLGLMRKGKPYAGAVFFPALRHLYEGVAGAGAWYDGQPIAVLEETPIQDRAVLYTDAKSHREYRITYPGKTRSVASTAFHYLLVARGVAVGAVSTAHIWDYIAAAAILETAGGVLRHLDGRPINWRDHLAGKNIYPPVLGAPPALWESVADTITFLGS